MNPNSETNAHDFATAVHAALDEIPGNQALASGFLSAEKPMKRYVVGRNEQSAELIEAVGIDGLIDDFEKVETDWNGVPILPMSRVPLDAVVANCSTSISPVGVAETVLKAGINNIVGINELIYASSGSLSWPWFVRQQREDFLAHSAEWNALYESMADQASRQTLLDVVRYRMTADVKYMRGYRVRLIEQYFEDFLELDDEVFVDAGGYDGDTTEEFCRRYPGYRKVFLFEPSVSNMQAAKARLASQGNIEFLTVGLSDEEGKLSFNPDGGSASAVSDSGSDTVSVTTLDQCIGSPVSFIKMDLEGWEMKALAGSVRHIRNDRPKLAIAVYHGASDFREIPRLIQGLNPEYRIYLRHYTQGWSETVMYFVEK
jgi:FkbM family methyltransferase